MRNDFDNRISFKSLVAYRASRAEGWIVSNLEWHSAARPARQARDCRDYLRRSAYTACRRNNELCASSFRAIIITDRGDVCLDRSTHSGGTRCDQMREQAMR